MKAQKVQVRIDCHLKVGAECFCDGMMILNGSVIVMSSGHDYR